MRRLVVLLSCLCALAAFAQVSKVTPVSPVEPVKTASAEPCSDSKSGMGKVTDMKSALKTMAAAASEPSEWEQAADDVLALAESIQKLTPDQRQALAELEEGKSPQQIFAARLALLKMVAKR